MAHTPNPRLAAAEHLVTREEELERLYAAPGAPSVVKEVPHLTASYRALIAASPFCVLATVGPEGLDCSPRGDAPGFVHVEDERTLLLPDRRGNNRIDSLRNVVRDPRVALLFFIPGVSETLRVNGTAVVSVDPALRTRFAVEGAARSPPTRPPASGRTGSASLPSRCPGRGATKSVYRNGGVVIPFYGGAGGGSRSSPGPPSRARRTARRR